MLLSLSLVDSCEGDLMFLHSFLRRRRMDSLFLAHRALHFFLSKRSDNDRHVSKALQRRREYEEEEEEEKPSASSSSSSSSSSSLL